MLCQNDKLKVIYQ